MRSYLGATQKTTRGTLRQAKSTTTVTLLFKNLLLRKFKAIFLHVQLIIIDFLTHELGDPAVLSTLKANKEHRV